MSLLLYFRYFLNSLRQRGFAATFLIPFYEWKYERFFGIKTSGIKKSSSERFFHYQGATYYTLFQLKDLLKSYSATHAFFDIGCGKGRAMIVAAHFGFKNIYGIELDVELTAVANKNIKLSQAAFPEIEFHAETANALETKYPELPCVFFLFNPFDAQTLKEVLQHIGKSGWRQHVFIYVNPQHKEVFTEAGFTIEKEIYTGRYCEAIVFRAS